MNTGLSTGNANVYILAGYRVLLTINQQCKLWRTKHETDSVPINTANHVALWKMLIDRNLPNYFILKESQPVIVINSALEAIRNVFEFVITFILDGVTSRQRDRNLMSDPYIDSVLFNHLK